MITHTVVQPYYGIVFSSKRERSIDTCNDWYGSQGHYAELKKSNHKRSYIILFNLYYVLRMTKLYISEK